MKKAESTEAAAPPEVRTAEAWATAKGMLPQFREAHAPFRAPGTAAPLEHNPNHGRFAAARAYRVWPEGKELTEAEFDAAVTAAETQIYR